VEITDRFGGEALWKHTCFGEGDLVLADAGYGYNKSFRHALQAGAKFLIRFNFATVTLFDELGSRILAEEATRRFRKKEQSSGSWSWRIGKPLFVLSAAETIWENRFGF